MIKNYILCIACSGLSLVGTGQQITSCGTYTTPAPYQGMPVDQIITPNPFVGGFIALACPFGFTPAFGVQQTPVMQRYFFMSGSKILKGPLDGNGGGLSVSVAVFSRQDAGSNIIRTYNVNNPGCYSDITFNSVFYVGIDSLVVTSQTATTVSFKWRKVTLNYEYAVTTNVSPPGVGSIVSDTFTSATVAPGVKNYIHVKAIVPPPGPFVISGACWQTISFCPGSATASAIITPFYTKIPPGGSQLLQTGGGTSYQWYVNNTPIAGATGPAHAATVGGRYNVDVINDICTSQSSYNGWVEENATPVIFTGKVVLQGAYNTSIKRMNSSLNSGGILQTLALNQPYNTAPFNYVGTESVSAAFFNARPDIVDWVLVELRDRENPSLIRERQAAFVRTDGSLIDFLGSSEIKFKTINSGYYYVAIRHRNHLGIRSAVPVDFSQGWAGYDFTITSSSSYSNQPYTSTILVNDMWMMRAGDANSNGSVKYNGPGNDQNQILNIKLGGSLSQVMNSVYTAEDVNMNGNVKWNGPDNDQNFLLNYILGGSLSLGFQEQL